MPFQSKAQRRYLHAKAPTVADRFEAHTPDPRMLPERKISRKRKPSKGRAISRPITKK